MKKIIAIIGLLAFICSESFAVNTKAVDVGQGLSINIPSNTNYFQIRLKKIRLEFPEISDTLDNFESLGFKGNSQLTIISDNNKSLKLWKHLSNKKDFEKIKKNYWDPYMQVATSKELEDYLIANLEKKGKNLNKMSEKQLQKEIAKIMKSKDFIKKIEDMTSSITNKFNKEFDSEIGTTFLVLTSDKEVPIKDLIGNKTPAMLKKDIKDLIKEASKKDLMMKPYTKWDFEIKKNHSGILYLYSDEPVPQAIETTKKVSQSEVFIISNNNKLFAIGSSCYTNCKKKGEIFKMISATGLYDRKIKKNIGEDNSSDNLVNSLNELNQLYKSGALTEEEFEKAKKKLLN